MYVAIPEQAVTIALVLSSLGLVGKISSGGWSGSSSTLSGDSMTRARSLLTTASDLIQRMGWTGLGQSIIGTVALVVALGFGDILNAFFQIFINIFMTIATLIPMVNEATLGGLAEFLGSSLAAGASAFGGGWTGLLGPLQAPLGVAIFLLSLWEVLYFMDVVNTDVLGVFAIDVPFISSDESAAAGDEGE
ncbi:MAG: hypothetical protein ABEJ47_01310 [Halorhabdus sp.]